MKPNKQLAIGILITAFAFLAIAAFPPTWNSGQFRSTGGVFSHLPGGNLGTNMTTKGGFSMDFTGSAPWSFSGNATTMTLTAPSTSEVLIITNADGGISILGNLEVGGTAHLLSDIETDGNLIVTTAGKGLQIKEGSNAKMGTATLVDGTVTVSTTAVTANSRIFLTRKQFITDGPEVGHIGIGTVIASTSFVIESKTNMDVTANDDSVIAWMIVEPAP